ncbi:MAG TPA: L,D-transpeptidase family protein [Bacteroidia bacterium]|nr:L,D-transpeptidase family protein [Bacteroidia bacterium]
MKPSKLIKFILYFTLAIFFSCTGNSNKDADTDTHQVTAGGEDTTLYVLPQLSALLIDSVLQSHPFLDQHRQQVQEFYSRRDFRPAWMGDRGLYEQTGEVVNLINDYLAAGIVDSTIFLKGIAAIYDTLSSDTYPWKSGTRYALQADILFTSQFFVFSDKAWVGKSASEKKDLEWFLPEKQFSRIDYLDSLLRMSPSEITRSEPVFRQYHALREKLETLVEIQKSGGWDTISAPANVIKPGTSSGTIAVIRKRLGLPLAAGEDIMLYDSALVEKIKEQQELFGLNSTGIIDKKLVREWNVSVEDRIRKILINLERWKWVPADPGSNFIAVNIPEFVLHVFEKGKEAWNMRVIVGKRVNQTVIFSGDLKYIVFAPYWNVPRSILVNEILPATKKNPDYLAAHKMEIVYGNKVIPASSINWKTVTASGFPYSVRQKPGNDNSLGLVKFLFPNNYSIYLHDTPSKWLFEKEDRDFSHGCIRLAEPQRLASYLLRNNPEWTPEKINTAMNADKEKYVTLKDPVPVYITYFTAWVDSKGRLNYRDDIYGHDARLAHMLFENEK